MNESDQLQDLIDEYLNGSLNPADGAELSRWLDNSRAARDQFRERIAFHESLYEHFSETNGTIEFVLPSASETSTTKSRDVKSFAIGLAGAFAILVACLLWFTNQNSPDTDFVARVVSSDSIAPISLPRGPFALETGFVEIEMANGARIALEAGAEVEFLGKDRLRLIRGSLGANVPPRGRGFTVVTPGGEIVDLGTRFGVSVSEQRIRAELFEGEFEVHSEGGKRAFQGQKSVTISQTGEGIRDLGNEVDASMFPMPELVEVIPIARGDFEPGDTFEIGGEIRDVLGRWGGNYARIVTANTEIEPFQGKGMLQLISSFDELEPSNHSFCDVYQWVDLRPFAFDRAQISATMMVNRVSGDAETDSRFSMIVSPHRELTASAPDLRPRKSQISWNTALMADADPNRWEKLSLTAELPPNTRFLQLHVGAAEDRLNDSAPGETEFDGHFIDHVQLELRIPARPSLKPASQNP